MSNEISSPKFKKPARDKIKNAEAEILAYWKYQHLPRAKLAFDLVAYVHRQGRQWNPIPISAVAWAVYSLIQDGQIVAEKIDVPDTGWGTDFKVKPSQTFGAPQKLRRRAGKPRKPSGLTDRQIEIVQIVGECKGNIALAARKLGRDRKTIDEVYRAGMAKLGKTIYRSIDKTRLLVRDRRGQETVSEADDLRRQ
jgi:DNA-binding CsgD family transcriptional regulator